MKINCIQSKSKYCKQLQTAKLEIESLFVSETLLSFSKGSYIEAFRDFIPFRDYILFLQRLITK